MTAVFFDKRPRLKADEAQALNRPASDRTRLTIARWIQRSRKARPTTAGMADLYGEPAWDIILDLYINGKSSTEIYVSSLCVGADLPIATCIRYMSMLARAGWVTRTPDAVDHRRVLVALSPSAIERMDCYFDHLAETWPDAVDVSHADVARRRG